MKNYKEQELLIWWMNAVATRAGALGHAKAQRNELAANQYKERLKDRGYQEDFFNEEDAFKYGVFNGLGSR